MAINLTELFEVQRKLDAEIERKHPVAPEEDRLAKRILALQVELGELANEWRGFKFWSTDREPRVKFPVLADCPNCDGLVIDSMTHELCMTCDATGKFIVHEKNLLLEEYVDCLHFILSIGIQLGFEERTINRVKALPQYSITEQFLEVTNDVTELYYAMDFRGFRNLISSFTDLGEMLGFTWEQITEAYMNKNKVNWERQENGY